MAMGFKAHQPHQIVQRHGEIGARGGGVACGDDPEPRQAHDMVDTHAAGMAERVAEHFDEGGEAGIAQPAR